MATTPEQRVGWAQQHLQRLRRVADEYLERVRPSETQTVTAFGGVSAVWLTVDFEPPTEIGLIAGDAIHNLRAALDNLMWELAPPAARNRSTNLPQFPIKETWQEFAKTLGGVLAGFDPRVTDAVRKVQTFVQPQDGGLPGDGSRLLALLNNFWNDDKHRVPVVGVAVAGGPIPGGTFQGSAAALARLPGMRMDVRFMERSGGGATVDDLDRIHSLLVNEVVPRLRSAT